MCDTLEIIDNNIYKIHNPNNISIKSKILNWDTAVGLQAVDNLCVSEYLKSVANKNIKGEISLDDTYKLINNYYENGWKNQQSGSFEADIVAVNINKCLCEIGFSLRPPELWGIHRQLFHNVYKHAGKFRDCNIVKHERVLDGDTVKYADCSTIKDALAYDFEGFIEQKSKASSFNESIEMLATFISRIWQVHPFLEGNTRTIAVFSIKLLNYYGVEITDNLFKNNSKYYRNALVAANYSNSIKNIKANNKPIQNFYKYLVTLSGNNQTISLNNNDLRLSN